MPEGEGMRVEIENGARHWKVYAALGTERRLITNLPAGSRVGPACPSRNAMNYRAQLRRGLVAPRAEAGR
ncbi:hypothetical protein [Amaricoccus solimangrovi]|uniref:Uncharacterized protein n=1 Tax=Amaricoccus solimangrovi TaxID=2589815 RepID=A0A501WHP6_9RHOB|nr:hypothetical protein [Amaricoccus solimangrovi]TPE47880.1 hypothetical protein FJM51_19275 [Amaricoccus solimangrovi]